MKILHCSDLHIDSKMHTNLSSDKARIRKMELVLTFEKMVKYASDEDVDVIIIAGDMFDTARVNSKTKNRIFDIIKSNHSIDFIYLAGNHDEENIISEMEEPYPNLKILKNEWLSFDYGKVVISGAILDAKNKNLYDTLKLNKETFNIVVLHGQISKYDSKDNAEIVNLSKLKNKNIDYLALGHIHHYETGKLDDRGIYCYAGCLEGRGFDECGEKGFVVIDINDKTIDHKFIPFAKRKLHEISFDISNKENWFDIEREILDKISSIPEEDLLKIVLQGKYCLSLNKQIEHLESKLNDEFFFVKIKDESTLQINVKDFEKDLSLRGEFIREILKSDLTSDEKEKAILVGLKALSGEEL